MGKEEIVLIEGFSRKSDHFLAGRTDTNKVLIVPFDEKIKEGTYIKAKVTRATHATLFGDFAGYADLSADNLGMTG